MSDQSCSDQMVNTAKCLAVHYESFSLDDWEYIKTTLALISGWEKVNTIEFCCMILYIYV